MNAVITIAFLALFNVIESKHVENTKGRRIMEESPNSRPNVVMQSVVLGKKKEKQRDETLANPDQMLGRLAEMLTEEDRPGGDGRNCLYRLEKILNRVKSKILEDYGFVESPRYRKYKGNRYNYDPCEDYYMDEYEPDDLDERFPPKTAKYASVDYDDDYEIRPVKYSYPGKNVYKYPKFADKILVKRQNPYKWRKQEIPCDRSTKDILYIPNSVVSKFQDDVV
ncbi:uncharacterized protein LOC106669532 [Cimex lectularius]|uniref:Uncharacterized protein n=1 Tax=Cimex lectularius TaxID=79782 RepID=A0A8I6TG79_CIMLE|nr:uncharacterized protein LOC106669532 [Cimex lectularius]